jgi:hypothetical protein
LRCRRRVDDGVPRLVSVQHVGHFVLGPPFPDDDQTGWGA